MKNTILSKPMKTNEHKKFTYYIAVVYSCGVTESCHPLILHCCGIFLRGDRKLPPSNITLLWYIPVGGQKAATLKSTKAQSLTQQRDFYALLLRIMMSEFVFIPPCIRNCYSFVLKKMVTFCCKM